MKFKIPLTIVAAQLALMGLIAPCQAAGEKSCLVSVAALNLPPGSDGLLHVRAADTATTPLQLSTRYFSEPLKMPGKVILFYKNPIEEKQEPPLPKPVVAVKIPEGTKSAYIVLWTDADENNKIRWRSNVFSAKDWDESTLKVINACSEQLGISAGKKPIKLSSGKSVDFSARDWGKSFPVRIFQLKPKEKKVFSSTWRVSKGRRELCLIANVNGRISLRSLLELSAPAPPDNS